MTTLLSPRLTEALGWTLLHSLWQGAAFALLLGVVLVALRSYSAQARYVISVGLLAGFFLTAATTFYVQYHKAAGVVRPGVAAGTMASTVGAMDPADREDLVHAADVPAGSSALPLEPSPTGQALSDRTTVFRAYFQRHLPLLVTLWLVGVLVLQLRWLGQLALVQRLRHRGTRALPDAWRARITDLEAKLRIRRSVAYRLSDRIATPQVIGWLKPVVLLPTALSARLTATEAYAVLAHELAHVRRDDFAVNLLQTLLTNAFFFHPGVWWMSARIDDEREHCCDDLAVAALGDALPYARTLLRVSEGLPLAQYPASPLALPLSGKPSKRSSTFAVRIRRLFGAHATTGTFGEGIVTAGILGATLLISFAASTHTDARSSTAPAVALARTLPIPTTAPASTPHAPLAALGSPFRQRYSTSFAQPSVSPAAALRSLVRACYGGDLAEVRQLVEGGADVNGHSSDGYTPLIAAASGNHVDVLAYLLDRGADIDRVSSGWTALIEAADEGAYAALDLLLERGARVDLYAGPGAPTALAMAAGEGRLRCLRRLLEAGADVNGFGESETPLARAAGGGQLAAIHALLNAGADPEHRDASGRIPRDYALAENQHRAAVALGADREHLPEPSLEFERRRRLRKLGFDDWERDTSRALAARRRAEFALLRADLQRNRAELQRRRALHFDSLAGAMRAPTFKFEAVADSLRRSAAQFRFETLARVDSLTASFDEAGGSPDELDPLLAAAYTGDTEALDRLIAAGADVNASQPFAVTEGKPRRNGSVAWRYDEATALLIAVHQGNVECVRRLLSAGADAERTYVKTERKRGFGGRGNTVVISRDDWTALRQAREQGDRELIRLLDERAPRR